MPGAGVSSAGFGPAFPGEREEGGGGALPSSLSLRKDSRAEVAACRGKVRPGCLCPGQ